MMCCVFHEVIMSDAGASCKVEKIGWTRFCLSILFQGIHLDKQQC
jgi:hypothetical protein